MPEQPSEEGPMPSQLMSSMDPQNWQPDFTETQEILHGVTKPALKDPMPREGSMPLGQSMPPPPVAGQDE